MPQIQSPTGTEMELVSPTDSLPPEVKGNRMKKELGLLEGCAFNSYRAMTEIKIYKSSKYCYIPKQDS